MPRTGRTAQGAAVFPCVALDGRPILVVQKTPLPRATAAQQVFLLEPRGAVVGVEQTRPARRRPLPVYRVKGVKMKRIAVMALAVLGLFLSTSTSRASWGHLSYSGYQPWWNVFAKRYK